MPAKAREIANTEISNLLRDFLNQSDPVGSSTPIHDVLTHGNMTNCEYSAYQGNLNSRALTTAKPVYPPTDPGKVDHPTPSFQLIEGDPPTNNQFRDSVSDNPSDLSSSHRASGKCCLHKVRVITSPIQDSAWRELWCRNTTFLSPIRQGQGYLHPQESLTCRQDQGMMMHAVPIAIRVLTPVYW